MSFELQDNWEDVPEYLAGDVVWTKLPDIRDGLIFAAHREGEDWSIRINDFPDEPLYTLIVDGREIIHFNDWPAEWRKPA